MLELYQLASFDVYNPAMGTFYESKSEIWDGLSWLGSWLGSLELEFLVRFITILRSFSAKNIKAFSHDRTFVLKPKCP